MKKTVLVGVMVLIAVGVGVLAVYAEWFSGGVLTPGILIAPDENTGTYENNTLTFGEGGAVHFQGGVGGIVFEGDEVLMAADGGWQWYGSSTGGPFSAVANGPAEDFFEDICADYASATVSAGVAMLQAPTAVVTAGEFQGGTSCGSNFEGVYLFGQTDEDNDSKMVSLAHVGPIGGMIEGTSNIRPVAELATLVPSTSSTTNPTAYVTVRGNDTEGEVEMGNAIGTSITITAGGSIIAQLGDIGPGSPKGSPGGGNTGNMMARPGLLRTQSSEDTESPPPGGFVATPRLGVHAIKPPAFLQ